MAKTLGQLGDLSPKISHALEYGYAEAMAQPEHQLWFQQLLGQEDTTDLKYIDFVWLQDRVGLRETLSNDSPTYRRILGENWRQYLRYWENAIEIDIYTAASKRVVDPITKTANQIGALVARKPQDLMCEAFNDGDTSAFVMFDGQNLYANAHPKGGTTFDNLLGPLSLDLTGIQAARTAMRRFPSDEGTSQPLDIIGDYVWHSVENESAAAFLLQNQVIASASSSGVFAGVNNPWYGKYTPITDARIDDINDWGLVANSMFIKPFVAFKHETEGDPVLIVQDKRDGTNDAFVMQKAYRYLLRFAKNVVPSRPELHLKVVN